MTEERTKQVPQTKDGYYRLDLPENFNACLGYSVSRSMPTRKVDYKIEMIKTR